MSESDKYFTVVFIGHVRKLGFNPLTKETAFGEPVSVSVGDVMSQLDEVEALVERTWPEADDLIDEIRKIRSA
jgi:hydrogenase maturation factor